MKKYLKTDNSQVLLTKSSFDYRTYFFFFLFVVLLGVMIIKEVSLPTPLIVVLAGSSFLALLFLAFSKPIFPLLVLIAYAPFALQFTGQFGLEITGFNLTNILMFFAFIGLVWQSLKQRQNMFQISFLGFLIILLCLWGLLTILRSKFLYGVYYQTEDFFILFKRWVTPILLFFFVFQMVKDPKDFKEVLFIVLLVTVVIAGMAVRDYLHYGDRGSIDESRIGGIFNQPNMLGAFFVYNMFFFLAFFLYYWRSFKYWLLLLPFLLCFRGIMVTFSRGAYIAFACAGAAVTFFKNKVLFLIVLVCLIASLLNPVYLPEGIRRRMASTFFGEKVISTDIEEIKDPSAGRRIMIWQGALAMIKDQPIFGFGYGTFPYVIGNYVPNLAGADAHNTYLILAAEMGVPALGLFVLILLVLLKNSWWLLRKTKERYFKAFALGMLGCLVGLIVANIFGSRLNSEEVGAYFWVYSGLLLSAVKMKRENSI